MSWRVSSSSSTTRMRGRSGGGRCRLRQRRYEDLAARGRRRRGPGAPPIAFSVPTSRRGAEAATTAACGRLPTGTPCRGSPRGEGLAGARPAQLADLGGERGTPPAARGRFAARGLIGLIERRPDLDQVEEVAAGRTTGTCRPGLQRLFLTASRARRSCCHTTWKVLPGRHSTAARDCCAGIER